MWEESSREAREAGWVGCGDLGMGSAWTDGSRMLLAEGVLQYLARLILQSSQAASILERVSDEAMMVNHHLLFPLEHLEDFMKITF